jgi:UDP-N-acetylglucosamine--N-acetylmuramyl-(pentapeptide) pyrophosphoryl-undecaprenol N-acetylglucosamine transferase
VVKEAAILIADRHAESDLVDQTLKLLKDKVQMEVLSKNIAELALPSADVHIAEEVLKIAK